MHPVCHGDEGVPDVGGSRQGCGALEESEVGGSRSEAPIVSPLPAEGVAPSLRLAGLNVAQFNSYFLELTNANTDL